MDERDFSWEDFLADIERSRELRKLREKHPYILDIIRVFHPDYWTLSRPRVIDLLERQRAKDGLPIPKAFEQSVDSAFQRACIDSKKCEFTESEALFRWPDGPRAGKWAARRDQCEAWLKKLSNSVEKSV